MKRRFSGLRESPDEFGIGPEYAEAMATFRVAKALDAWPTE